MDWVLILIFFFGCFFVICGIAALANEDFIEGSLALVVGFLIIVEVTRVENPDPYEDCIHVYQGDPRLEGFLEEVDYEVDWVIRDDGLPYARHCPEEVE